MSVVYFSSSARDSKNAQSAANDRTNDGTERQMRGARQARLYTRRTNDDDDDDDDGDGHHTHTQSYVRTHTSSPTVVATTHITIATRCVCVYIVERARSPHPRHDYREKQPRRAVRCVYARNVNDDDGGGTNENDELSSNARCGNLDFSSVSIRSKANPTDQHTNNVMRTHTPSGNVVYTSFARTTATTNIIFVNPRRDAFETKRNSANEANNPTTRETRALCEANTHTHTHTPPRTQRRTLTHAYTHKKINTHSHIMYERQQRAHSRAEEKSWCVVVVWLSGIRRVCTSRGYSKCARGMFGCVCVCVRW